MRGFLKRVIYAVRIYNGQRVTLEISQGGMEMGQMTEQGNDNHCDWSRWWYSERRRRTSIGIFLIVIGGLWMAAKLGLFNQDFFWPLAFITMGTWFIVSPLVKGKSRNLSR